MKIRVDRDPIFFSFQNVFSFIKKYIDVGKITYELNIMIFFLYLVLKDPDSLIGKCGSGFVTLD